MKNSPIAIATFVFAAALSCTLAADQVATTHGTLFLGASQSLAQSTLCLNGQSTCRGLGRLEDDDRVMRGLEQGGSGSAFRVPANETSGAPEMVCFGPYPHRCYGWYERRLEEVVDEHRRLERTGDSEVKDVSCIGQEWGLQCN
ncbi:hypothetical protein PHYPSEUDO_000361 [Phytophthora pseudosyringae]|uniref:Uncharacterized protein n=1 Tax=Phytophthora pseudosyringae TaxID=221518 RepID=A0A8T1V3Y8_9STRA|nr:hypothetical protein PHYPSEUDO_000361 [Phytophthora pseudosyringae]